MQSLNVSMKKLSLVAAAGAVAVMGVVTFAASSPHDGGSGGSSVMADTPTASGPASTPPSVPSAVPQVKATKFAGGDWTGM
jgi:hypothetical protein